MLKVEFICLAVLLFLFPKGIYICIYIEFSEREERRETACDSLLDMWYERYSQGSVMSDEFMDTVALQGLHI